MKGNIAPQLVYCAARLPARSSCAAVDWGKTCVASLDSMVRSMMEGKKPSLGSVVSRTGRNRVDTRHGASGDTSVGIRASERS